MPTQYRNAIVLVLDYLNANMLGAYGNTWVETPNLDRLASESLVFEQVIANSVDLTGAYDKLWNHSQANLIQTLGDQGIRTHLLSDEPDIIGNAIAEDFEHATSVDTNPGRVQSGLKDSIDQTELAHFFAHASDWVSKMERGCLGWLHSRGLGGAWDAPYSLRQSLAHPEDPEPPEFHAPPAHVLGSDDDPDDLLGYQQACAAQIVLIDEFLGVLLDLMDSDSRWDSTLLCVTSSRGFPMGEHGLVGVGNDDAKPGQRLHNESVHLPMMVRLPKGEQFDDFRATRIGNLIQPDWLNRFLQTWFVGGDQASRAYLESLVFSFPDRQTEWAVTESQSVSAIQTHAWKLIKDSSGMSENYQLFAKPDDIWETNDVSRRCPQIVEQLAQLLDEIIQGNSEMQKKGYELPEDLAVRFD